MEKTEHNSSNLAKQEATGDENQFFSRLEKLAHHVSRQQKTSEDQLFTVVDQIIIRLRGTDHVVKNLTTSYQTQHNYQQDCAEKIRGAMSSSKLHKVLEGDRKSVKDSTDDQTCASYQHYQWYRPGAVIRIQNASHWE